MAVKVRIPTPLQKLAGGQSELTAEGATLKEVLINLEAVYPGFMERLYSEEGELRRFINIYVNEEDIRFLESDNTAVKDGDTISIIPAIAGGSR